MKVIEIKFTLDKKGEAEIAMFLEQGRDHYFRKWIAQTGAIPRDPVAAWQRLQELVAGINPTPFNEDTNIESITQKIGASSSLVRT
jgi:hypothetical protein